METLNLDTQECTCDTCGQKTVVFKNCLGGRVGKSATILCTNCTERPITIEPVNSDKPFEVVGIPLTESPVMTKANRMFSIEVNYDKCIVTVSMSNLFKTANKNNIVVRFHPSKVVMIGWDAFAVGGNIYNPGLKIHGENTVLTLDIRKVERG